MLGIWVEPMHALVLVEVASILLVHVSGSWLPWLLALSLNGVLFIFASIIIMMIIVTMSRTIVCYLVPLLASIILLFDPHIGGSSDSGVTSVCWCRTGLGTSLCCCELLCQFCYLAL